MHMFGGVAENLKQCMAHSSFLLYLKSRRFLIVSLLESSINGIMDVRENRLYECRPPPL